VGTHPAARLTPCTASCLQRAMCHAAGRRRAQPRKRRGAAAGPPLASGPARGLPARAAPWPSAPSSAPLPTCGSAAGHMCACMRVSLALVSFHDVTGSAQATSACSVQGRLARSTRGVLVTAGTRAHMHPLLQPGPPAAPRPTRAAAASAQTRSPARTIQTTLSAVRMRARQPRGPLQTSARWCRRTHAPGDRRQQRMWARVQRPPLPAGAWAEAALRQLQARRPPHWRAQSGRGPRAAGGARQGRRRPRSPATPAARPRPGAGAARRQRLLPHRPRLPPRRRARRRDRGRPR